MVHRYVIYGTLRGWSPEYFRATLQAYFLPASIAGMAGYAPAGLWTPAVNHFYLVSLPGVVMAIFLGRSLNRRMHSAQFVAYVYVGLSVIGVVLLLQAISGWSCVCYSPPQRSSNSLRGHAVGCAPDVHHYRWVSQGPQGRGVGSALLQPPSTDEASVRASVSSFNRGHQYAGSIGV